MTLFRPTSLHSGVWCSLLLTIALYTSFPSSESETLTSDLKRVTLTLSFALFLISVNASYGLVYALASEKSGGIMKLVFQSVVSDLFERRGSAEVRLQREEERRAKAKERRPSAFDFKREANRALLFDLVVAMVLGGYLWKAGPSSIPAWVILFSAASVFIYGRFLPELFNTFPASFTYGEGCIVLQGCTLFLFEASASLLLDSDDTASLEGAFATIAKAGLVSCSLLCAAPLLPGLRWVGRSSFFVPCGLALLVGATLPFLYFTLKRDPISWVLDIIFESYARMFLMATWMLCVGLSVYAVNGQTKTGAHASTRTRKVFHALATAVYASGVLLDMQLLFLGSIVALCVFLLLESVRVHEVKPFAAWLDAYFALFLDEKDQGKLILSNIYLLVGCSLPLWLSHEPLSSASQLALLSGVLSIGIGDSFASIAGSQFGKTKLPDSDKSLEGTTASVLSQLAFIWLLLKAGLLSSPLSWSKVVPPVVIVALVEALTTQVDNLVLPIILYSMLS